MSAARSARVASGEKAGSAGRADGALREGGFEEDALFGEAVQVGGVYIRVAITAEGVKALLVGADPEDVWFVGHEDLVLYTIKEMMFLRSENNHALIASPMPFSPPPA